MGPLQQQQQQQQQQHAAPASGPGQHFSNPQGSMLRSGSGAGSLSRQNSSDEFYDAREFSFSRTNSLLSEAMATPLGSFSEGRGGGPIGAGAAGPSAQVVGGPLVSLAFTSWSAESTKWVGPRVWS